jgi:hypothetical protein
LGHICSNTILADLLTLLLVANPFSAMRAPLLWWLGDKFEEGLTDGGQYRLRWRPVDFFSCFEPAALKESVGDDGGCAGWEARVLVRPACKVAQAHLPMDGVFLLCPLGIPPSTIGLYESQMASG